VTCYLRRQPIQRFIARQQLRKHATVLETLLGSSPRVNNEVQLEAVFSVRSVLRLYHAIDSSGIPPTRVEAGSNTSTVTLRVEGGDEKESLKTETVKYGREIQGTRT
jgi:hypothetical protein